MNFLLLRSNTTAAQHPPPQESPTQTKPPLKPATTLEGLISEDPFPGTTSSQSFRDGDSDVFGNDNGIVGGLGGNSDLRILDNHIDVTEEEGWIIIPHKEVPDNWSEAPDIQSFRSLDRSFVFPGEQVHVLACLSAYKQDIEIITPFKLAALMTKNGIGQSPNKQNENTEIKTGLVSERVGLDVDDQDINQNGIDETKGNINIENNMSDGESLLRLEDHRRQTESLLRRFNESNFFARIAESDEPLWSKRGAPRPCLDSSKRDDSESNVTSQNKSSVNVSVDRGNFDARASGGVARNGIRCCSLPNGDIVVLLQVIVGVDFLKDPVLEILQFEKFQERSSPTENHDSLGSTYQDPCGELLKWLLPLDNSIPPPARSLSPPPSMSSSSSIRSTSAKPTLSGPSGSQLFSFGHFRSYSMSSLPPNTTPPPSASDTKASFDLKDWDRSSSRKSAKSERSGSEGLLSFRGVSLEPQRFSVCCGLEGIYIPGRRWRRKIDIIQPLEIHSFAADCNTDDLVCVQIKNVSPARTPDIVVYLDAITIVFEEASKDGPPFYLPIACIEAGNDYSLPNLALRRGEEHSFILKPATSMWKNLKDHKGKSLPASQLQGINTVVSPNRSSSSEGKCKGSPADQYAVLVSCRCNYTESRLFFKQPTNWRPRISRDLMISVASEMSRPTLGSNEVVAQLPVQVLTLQASNLTSEDLTLTVLAPASFTSPPSVVSLSSSPSSPMSPFVDSSELTEEVNSDVPVTSVQSLNSVSMNHGKEGEGRSRSVSFNENAVPFPDVLPSGDLGCTHLWLQSRVPLGRVPSQSTATIKLEVLPLTDGIITLDSLQIDVKERGITYVPEHSLKINATSSVATGIL